MSVSIIIDDNKVHDLEMMTNYACDETTKMPLLVSYIELDPILQNLKSFNINNK